MPPPYTLWFNPRCSKCRRALELLQEKGIEPDLRRYLETPPTGAELEALLGKLPEPHAAVRPGEPEYRTLGLSERSSRAELVKALAASPSLLERPILEVGDRAVVGRPPARVLELVAPAKPA
jgi:arsenate reductase